MLTTALLCLTLNVFHESRGESILTQEAVAAVTMNRTKDKSFPKDVCKVVYAKGAFSWTRHHHKIKDKVALEKAKDIARLYLSGKTNRMIGNRLYFNEIRLGKRFKTTHRPIVLGKLVMY